MYSILFIVTTNGTLNVIELYIFFRHDRILKPDIIWTGDELKMEGTIFFQKQDNIHSIVRSLQKVLF